MSPIQIIIISLTVGGLLLSLIYMLYRKIKHMPSIEEECCCSNKKRLLKSYRKAKRKELKELEKNN